MTLGPDGTLTLAGLTASRLVASDANKALSSVALSSWITGTAHQVSVTDNNAGGITLSAPQDIQPGPARPS